MEEVVIDSMMKFDFSRTAHLAFIHSMYIVFSLRVVSTY
jgi:hypothetical protein